MPGWPGHPGGAIWARSRAGLLGLHLIGAGWGDGRSARAVAGLPTAEGRLRPRAGHGLTKKNPAPAAPHRTMGLCTWLVQERSPTFRSHPASAARAIVRKGRAAVLETKECGPQGLPGGRIAPVMARRDARRVPSVRASGSLRPAGVPNRRAAVPSPIRARRRFGSRGEGFCGRPP